MFVPKDKAAVLVIAQTYKPTPITVGNVEIFVLRVGIVVTANVHPCK